MGQKVGWREIGYLNVGLEVAVAFALGLGLGVWFDRKLGSEPWLTLLGLALGMGAGVWRILQLVAQEGKQK